MRRFSLYILYVWAFLCCGSAAAQDVSFPYPDVPAAVASPAERLAFVVEHFWERYDFAAGRTDTLVDAVGEQGFSDFILLLSYADSLSAQRGTAAFAAAAFADTLQRRRWTALMDHYLGNPASPVRNDAVYALLLRSLLPYTAEASAERLRGEYRLAQAQKNLPGTQAADFAFLRRDGTAGSLYEIEAPFTLLFFHDPDCENCARFWPLLLDEPLLQRADVRVVAVYADADTEQWQSAPSHGPLPPNWDDVCSPDGEIVARELYHLPATPSFYLLDAAKRVLLKDAPIATVLETLAAQTQ